jgi:phytoene synthase
MPPISTPDSPSYSATDTAINSAAREQKLRDSFRRAQALHRHHGKSYYFASQLFPPDLRQSTYALYAFFRVPDEIVDNSPQNTPAECAQVVADLESFLERWHEAYRSGESDDPVLHVTAHTFERHQIPFELSEDFLRAMMQDVTVARYQNYEQLREYMWGSAATVGVMMSHVIGFTDQSTLEYAPKLGYAMQLTNFLRDIDEDYQQRGRIYLPQDEMAQFGISDDDIARRNFSPAFREFMRWQAERCHRLYEEANAGVPLLDKRGRRAVIAASALYRAILGRLAAQDWNPFAGRAKTNLPAKVLLAGRAMHQHRNLFK